MFFNPLNKSSVDPNYQVLATAQLTITDQTDASNLAGNLTIVSGSKSQVYLTGTSQPYNPDWKMKNLVIRPYMIASNVFKGSSTNKYNPDLFDPREYSNLESPGDINVSTKYIHDIAWYLVDSAGNQTLINVESDQRFSHTWTYKNTNQQDIIMKDKRTLVIKDNILTKDAVASIMVKFSFHDPFADIRIPVVYEMQLNNLSTGLGTTKAMINSVDGNAFYNAGVNEQLKFEANYYNEGSAVDLESKLSNPVSQLKVEWFIRTSNGWTILDAASQDDSVWNRPGDQKLYEIHRVVQRKEDGTILKTEKTTNRKGGTVLVVTPGLITGSDTIKLVITDDEKSDLKSSALENVYDYSDPTQCYVHSTNGDKLFKGMYAPGTTISAVVTYKGELLNNDDPRYDTMFDYYWYRIDQLGDVIENMYYDEFDTLQFISTTAPNYKEDGFPMASKRAIDIKTQHIDYKATFSVDLLNKQEAKIARYKNNLLRSMPTEEEIRDAQIMIVNAGLNKYNNKEILNTAKDIRAFKIAQEDNIKESFK